MGHALGLALIGGMLIGVAAGLFLLIDGRIAGISGIAGGLLGRWPSRWPADLAFLAGLPLGLALYRAAGGIVAVHLPGSIALLIGAGFLVGFGARMANGCTSGHAVCGLARLSKRSLAATLVFTAAAMLAVAVEHAL
jgi:uncharacterized membrane protein YedE/YeeE